MGNSHRAVASGHLVDATVPPGYMPWYEIAGVFYCNVVVCDILFGLISSLTGEGRLLSMGEARYESSARYDSCPAASDFFNRVFTVWNILFLNPLLF